jgi:hypothetical protein
MAPEIINKTGHGKVRNSEILHDTVEEFEQSHVTIDAGGSEL